jgi:hypothetical protein
VNPVTPSNQYPVLQNDPNALMRLSLISDNFAGKLLTALRKFPKLHTRVRFRVFTGTINILDFYARRVRRLLPALAVVLVATLAAGALVLIPSGEQQDLAASALATAAFQRIMNECGKPFSAASISSMLVRKLVDIGSR